MLRFTAFCFLFCTALCPAADWSTLYDTAKIKAEQPRLRVAVDYLLQKEIQPFIPPQQATTFGLQEVDVPLEGWRTDPLDYYSEKEHIILPVRTLLFTEDLARAYGWMWTNRLSTKTIDEYLSMLRYRSPFDFEDGRYPSPLKALHVPDDALTDAKAVDISVRLRRSAYAFMVLHQFAHLQLRHAAGSNGCYSELQEEDADRYALNIMKGNSVTPTGIFLVMYSGMFFETGEGISIHPVSSPRLVMMAHFMDEHILEFIQGRPDQKTAMDGIHSIANLLVEAAGWLTVRGHQQELQQLAMKTDLATLQPRPLPKSTK